MAKGEIKDKSKNEAKREKIDKLFEGREHLKSKAIYNKDVNKIIEMLEVVETYSKKFKNLFTSSIWASNATNIREILSMNYWENPKYLNLLSPKIWSCTPQIIRDILGLEKLKEEKFSRLLSPNIWSHSLEFLKAFLSMPEWGNEAYRYLLNPSILEFSLEQISSTISLFEEFGLGSYITNQCIRSDTSLQRKLIEYLKRKNLPLLVADAKGNVKINPIINANISSLRKSHYKGKINLREIDVSLLEDDRFAQTPEQLGGQNGRNIK